MTPSGSLYASSSCSMSFLRSKPINTRSRSGGLSRLGACAPRPVGNERSGISCVPSACPLGKSPKGRDDTGSRRYRSTPCLWLQYAGHEMDPLRRSRRGLITPVMKWILYADHRMDPIWRSVTTEFRTAVQFRKTILKQGPQTSIFHSALLAERTPHLVDNTPSF